MEDWRHEVSNEDTRIGYWDWVEKSLAYAEDEEESAKDVPRPGVGYYATPCGTFCGECIQEHAKHCTICAKDFGLEQGEGEKTKMSKNANKTPKYQVIAQGNAVILTMTKNAAQLVADALDIINPDEAQNEDLARAIALDIQNAL